MIRDSIRTEDITSDEYVEEVIRRVFALTEKDALTLDDLRDSGLLYFINKNALHDFGFGLEVDEDGALHLIGTGREPLTYDLATHKRRTPDVQAVLAPRDVDIERVLERRQFHPFRRAGFTA